MIIYFSWNAPIGIFSQFIQDSYKTLHRIFKVWNVGEYNKVTPNVLLNLFILWTYGRFINDFLIKGESHWLWDTNKWPSGMNQKRLLNYLNIFQNYSHHVGPPYGPKIYSTGTIVAFAPYLSPNAQNWNPKNWRYCMRWTFHEMFYELLDPTLPLSGIFGA